MRTALAAFALALSIGPATANDMMAAIQTYLDEEIRTWSNDPAFVRAVIAQNAVTGAYSQDEIDRLDQIWMSEVGTPDSALIRGVLDHPVSAILRDRLAAADGIISEVFIMDARGLNVAAAHPTSDYWQGDEEKFTETFPIGADAVHVSDVEFDESSQRYQSQVSVSIVDPATGQTVGAITVGLNAERLN